jgi:hypothetical protein
MPEPSRRVDLRLTIPTSASYQPLAAELAAKFAEYSGASAADAKDLARNVAAAAARLAGTTIDGVMHWTMAVEGGALIVTATFGSATHQMTCPLPD